MIVAGRETPNQSLAKLLKVFAGFSFAANALLHLAFGGFGYGSVRVPFLVNAIVVLNVAAVPLFFLVFLVKPKMGLLALWSIAVLTYAVWVGFFWETCHTRGCYVSSAFNPFIVPFVLLPLAGAVLVSFASRLDNA